MKRKCSVSHARAIGAACTVSAAALMLGVSQAATVGLNFQCNWDSTSPSYTGQHITATAFGIPPSGWESLTPIPTGYNPNNNTGGYAGNPGPYTANETITTTSNGNGLHPLPRGSLSLTWTAVAGNCSGYTYNGNHPGRGNQEVLYGFLRDDLFIYTSPTSTPGYSMSITGLKTLFPGSQYVIQLVATTDSGTFLTNAVITAGTNVQDLTYTAVNPGGPTARGPMGGLSSVSTPLNADAIVIAGRPALIVTNGADAVWWASTISAIMITDVPLIQQSPQTPLAPFCEGSSTNLSVVAIGVPPLHYQWRRNGQPITGANSDSYSINNLSLANAGYYDVVVTNAYGSATSAIAAVTGDILIRNRTGIVVDSKTSGTLHHGDVNGDVAWVASSTDSTNVTRSGVAGFSAADPGRILLPGETNFDGATGTICFWMRSAGTVTNAANEGALLVDRTGGILVSQRDDGTVKVSAPFHNNVTSSGMVSDGNWHQVAIVYDQSDVGSLTLYIDGAYDTSAANVAAWSWTAGEPIRLGLSLDAYWRPYDGQLDDVRIYNRQLTDAEVLTVYTSGALVDASALQVRLNFDTAPTAGLSLDWLCSTLQTASRLPGPFADVTDASSPWRVIPSTPEAFYRVKH